MTLKKLGSFVRTSCVFCSEETKHLLLSATHRFSATSLFTTTKAAAAATESKAAPFNASLSYSQLR